MPPTPSSPPSRFLCIYLTALKVVPCGALYDERHHPHNSRVSVAGVVLVRQRPGTASGVVFITLEDETGIANLIVWAAIYEAYRKAARHATLLQVDGVMQREGNVVHVIARRLTDRTELIPGLVQPSRDFH